MKKTICAFILSLASFSLFAQDNYFQSVGETQEFSKKVVSLFKENKISECFQQLRPYWPLPKNEIDPIETKTIQYLNLLMERFGSPIGTLKTRNETIGDFAIQEIYLVRYEKAAIRVIIMYFKTPKGWIINTFKWDDSFQEEFK